MSEPTPDPVPSPPTVRPATPTGAHPPAPAPADQVAAAPSPEPPPTPPPGVYAYPPPGYQPQPGQVPPPYAYRLYAPTNTYAILAIIFACFVFPPVGIYFGVKAKEQIAITGERGIELAKAAIVVGWILTSIQAIIFLVWCGVFGTAILGGIAGSHGNW